MVRPERRTPTDLAIALLIVVVVAVGVVVVWYASSARRTTDVVAAQTAPVPEPLAALPTTLRPTWTAHSTEPFQVVAGTVVTGDGGTVSGIDATSGRSAWRYTRDEGLCGMISNTSTILAFYPDARGCGEVTALDPGTGQRRYARSSREDAKVTLTTDGSYVAVQSASRVDVLRSDLVLTNEYGTPDVPVNPGTQPRSGCTQLSAMPAGTQVAVLEHCPTEINPRLTLMASVPKDSATPEVSVSTVIPALGTDDHVRIVGAVSNAVAVYVPPQNGRPARLEVLGTDGTVLTSRDIASGPSGAPADVPITDEGGVLSFYTGEDTLVLDATTLALRLIIPETRGPGAVIGNQIVVPGASTLTAYDLASGREGAAVPVSRPGYTAGPIITDTAGQTVVCQWGDTVQAYRAG
ncbi:Rv3212 family protein [Tsukamurella soli]|uniref:Pyrrolo-quinoline quinone repeat domain-containing protein n=1 Tax=Tsukamurella soli TaxID=644556 RepID=A0ABP8K164_9ACTN